MKRLAIALVAAVLLTAQGSVQQLPLANNRATLPKGTSVLSPPHLFIKVAPTEKSTTDVDPEKATEKESLKVESRLADLTKDLADYTWLLFVATAVLAGITAGLLGLGFIQAFDNKRSIKASEAAAKAALSNANAILLAERAYVKVSPYEPGVQWDNPTGGGFTVSYRVKNFGSTPAKVTDVISNAIVVPNGMIFDEIPQNVRHTFPKETRSFLVKDDEFCQSPHTAIDATERQTVEKGDQKMIVYGYADYIDQFGVRHRAGFGRQYLPNGRPLNLVFPDSGLFNYDRERVQGEGIDWG